IEWQVARDLASRPRPGPTPAWKVILSAGLTPENVGRAIATARPYAVDVNSGVEASPGRKDPDKVWRFVAEAKPASRRPCPTPTVFAGGRGGGSSPSRSGPP